MKIFYSLIILILCAGVALSADVSGNQSGTWTSAEGTYNIVSNVTVPAGQMLTIEPGVEVIFTGLFRIQVLGTLSAQGTSQDSIIFRHQTAGQQHGSIDISTGTTASTLEYCRIQDGVADGSSTFGGGTDYHGAGVYVSSGSHIIRHCRIVNNEATYGGGMFAFGPSSLTIEANVFSGNDASLGGGIGLTGSACNPTITNNVFANNTASSGGGVNVYSDTEPVLFNNTFYNNSASLSGGGLNLYSNGNYVTVTNSIFLANTAPSGSQAYAGTHTDSLIIEYSSIEGGYTGTGNISSNPAFTDPANGDFSFEANSPIVDAGTNTGAPSTDFDGNVRPFDGDRNGTAVVDMGAYEYINTPPSITSDPVLTVEEESTYNYQVTATDPDVGETLTFSLDTAPAFLGITPTGLISANPDDAEVGQHSVVVEVSDLNGATDTQSFTLEVTPINDPPVITGQVALSTPEETALTIVLANLTVTDPDNTYPADFTLIVQDGTNYTRIGATITPATDYNGDLTVPVTVNDGSDNSNTFNLTVSVTPENDIPVIISQVALSTPEETGLTIVLANLTVTDPDNAYPADFTLSVQDGDNYTRNGNAITPVIDFNGNLTVPVTVNDGADNSAPFNLTVSVTPENDIPVITGQVALSTPEETALTIELANLTVTDPDNAYPADFTLIVQNGTNYTRSGNTITPVADFNGDLTVPVIVSDGTANSNIFNLTVSVTGDNDPPLITAQVPLSTPEETALMIVLANLTVTDPDNTYPDDFTLSVGDGTNYTRVGNTITPAADFNGDLTVPIVVNDGTDDSNTFNLTVSVTPENDAPIITDQVVLSTAEETALTIVLANLTVTDPDNAYPADFTLIVQDGTNYARSGNTITPATDFNGDLTVPVVVNDGTDNSAQFNLTVSVTPENDTPVITGQVALSTPEETALTIVLANLTITDPDNIYPDDFTLSVGDGTNYTRVGNTITPATEFSGDLTVPVVVNDGTDNSNTFNLIVSVTEYNDPPVITGQVALSTAEETALTIVLANLTVTDPDNAYPDDFTLSVGDGANYTRTGDTITPVADFNGDLSVPVVVNDGTASSDTFNLTVSVTPENDTPVITGQVALSTPEETALMIELANLTVTDPDNTYPDDFTLTVGDGANYTRTGNTITPVADFNGDLTVPVSVNDGAAESEVFNVTVSVDAVNDPPVISSIPDISFSEDDSLSMQITALYELVTDPETPDSALIFIFLTGENVYARIDSPQVIFKALENWHGIDSAKVVVSDGELSDTADVRVMVKSVNDVPYFTDVVPDTVEFQNTVSTILELNDWVADNDLPADNFRWQFEIGDDAVEVSFNAEMAELTLNAPDFVGTTILRFTVTDDSSAEAMDSLVVKVIADPTHIADLVSQIPTSYELHQNYPNPFNPNTHIKYGLPRASRVTIKLYNVIGQTVQTLLDDHKAAGYHIVNFDASHLPSGVYFYRIQTEEFTLVKKMILVR
jgi:hypothetical protein